MACRVEAEEWRGGDPCRGGQAEARELGDGGVGGGREFFPVGALEVDGADAGCGVLDQGREGEADREERGAGLGFGGGLRRAKQERGATCQRLRGGQAGFDAGGAGVDRGGEHEGFFLRAVEQCRGLAARNRIGAKHGVQREVGDVQDGEHGDEWRMRMPDDG